MGHSDGQSRVIESTDCHRDVNVPAINIQSIILSCTQALESHQVTQAFRNLYSLLVWMDL
jgi:hypothetical protein